MLEKRFKDKIRDAFDTWLNKTPRISNNSHVTFSADEILKNSSRVHKHKYGIIQNFVVRVKRGPEATLDYNVVITCASAFLVPLSIL